MQKEGYRLEDLEKAEKLSVQTGKKAMELIRAKGKASDNRKWSDVVKKEEQYHLADFTLENLEIQAKENRFSEDMIDGVKVENVKVTVQP